MSFGTTKAQSAQSLHALLEIQTIDETIDGLMERRQQLINVVMAIAMASVHPEIVRQVQSTREYVGNGNGNGHKELETA